MHWITFSILLYIAAALQSSHLGQLSETGYFHIEYLPALAVFYALLAERWSALAACFICGALYDITGDSLLGLQAILMTIAGYWIITIRMHVFRNNMISQGLITFFTVLFLLAARAVLAYVIIRLVGRREPQMPALTQTGIIFSSALYTAVVAPLLFKAMLLMGTLLGFENPHHRTARDRDRLM